MVTITEVSPWFRYINISLQGLYSCIYFLFNHWGCHRTGLRTGGLGTKCFIHNTWINISFLPDLDYSHEYTEEVQKPALSNIAGFFLTSYDMTSWRSYMTLSPDILFQRDVTRKCAVSELEYRAWISLRGGANHQTWKSIRKVEEPGGGSRQQS